MTKQQNWFERANANIRGAESSVVNFLSAIAPWGAPLAPAYMAYHGMTEILGFDEIVALILAGVIEILGLTTISTAFAFWQHNKKYKKDVRKMPVSVPVLAFAYYLVAVLTVNVALEFPVAPQDVVYVHIFAKGLLSTLAIPSAVTLAIRAQHTELLAEIKQPRTQPDAIAPQPKATKPQLPPIAGNRKAIYEQLQAQPDATQVQIAQQLGITRQAVGSHVEKLHEMGYLSNGHGRH